MNSLDGFYIAWFVTTLQTDGNHQILLLRFFNGVENSPNSGCVRSDWLFHENMATFIHRIFELLRLESRWGRYHDKVSIHIDSFFVSIQTTKDAVLRHIDLLCVLTSILFSEICKIISSFFGVRICSSNKLYISFGVHDVFGSTESSAAASNQNKLDFVTACSMSCSCDRACQCSTSCSRRRALKKISTV